MPLGLTTAVFMVLLAVVFGVWWARERTLSIHTIVTTPREAFYWLAILFTFALGTSVGDQVAEQFGTGKLGMMGTGNFNIVLARDGFTIDDYVAAVTEADLLSAARDVVRPEACSIVVVGDAAKFRPELPRFNREVVETLLEFPDNRLLIALCGEFDRNLSLPVQLDPDGIKAEYRHGVLALFLPRSEREKPRWPSPSVTARPRDSPLSIRM